MITVKNYEVLSHLVNIPDEGEYAVCTETSQVFQFKNGEWNRVEKPDAKLNITLYELNKTLYKSMPDLTFNEIQKKKIEVAYWVDFTFNKYYMLLNRELADYTLFALTDHGDDITDEIFDIAYNRGIAIKAVEVNKEEMWVQFWIKTKDDVVMYALFPYGNGVIECQK